MKFSIAAITLAAVAIASPTEMEARNGGGGQPPSGGVCNVNGNNDGKVVCCDSAIPIVGQLLCNVLAIGGTCTVSQSSYCCKTSANGGLINVSLLNCVNL
ncbi:hypothetical protein LEL_10973 [Akanthomyces lecanii RCEF 1005]|uniref:Hydrophobin n=1 Tax=Akanthomyces lecanii RCEF 1005 TaxID=1081108 RepID=A0A167NUZ0_CORDF|nr:hypothetical protein LEL_10973 [Akanthomyces lecanii RCEF 1005]